MEEQRERKWNGGVRWSRFYETGKRNRNGITTSAEMNSGEETEPKEKRKSEERDEGGDEGEKLSDRFVFFVYDYYSIIYRRRAPRVYLAYLILYSCPVLSCPIYIYTTR